MAELAFEPRSQSSPLCTRPAYQLNQRQRHLLCCPVLLRARCKGKSREKVSGVAARWLCSPTCRCHRLPLQPGAAQVTAAFEISIHLPSAWGVYTVPITTQYRGRDLVLLIQQFRTHPVVPGAALTCRDSPTSSLTSNTPTLPHCKILVETGL